jgi:hypothetical protein
VKDLFTSIAPIAMDRERSDELYGAVRANVELLRATCAGMAMIAGAPGPLRDDDEDIDRHDGALT